MLLENLREISIKQLEIQSSLASTISLRQAVCDMGKTKMLNFVRSNGSYLSYPTRVIQVQV